MPPACQIGRGAEAHPLNSGVEFKDIVIETMTTARSS